MLPEPLPLPDPEPDPEPEPWSLPEPGPVMSPVPTRHAGRAIANTTARIELRMLCNYYKVHAALWPR